MIKKFEHSTHNTVNKGSGRGQAKIARTDYKTRGPSPEFSAVVIKFPVDGSAWVEPVTSFTGNCV